MFGDFDVGVHDADLHAVVKGVLETAAIEVLAALDRVRGNRTRGS